MSGEPTSSHFKRFKKRANVPFETMKNVLICLNGDYLRLKKFRLKFFRDGNGALVVVRDS